MRQLLSLKRNEKNQMKRLRYEAIKQCSRLEEVDELPEIKDNSIFKKLTSLKKINGNVIITNCTNLKETCNYLQNIDIGDCSVKFPFEFIPIECAGYMSVSSHLPHITTIIVMSVVY